MIRGLLNWTYASFWRLARPVLLFGGAALVTLGLGVILLPLLLGLTLLAAAQWAAGESEEMPTVELAAN